jgi:hypothetical protein
MAKQKLTIGASPLTNTIFAGTLLKDGATWSANKQDVTVDALAAVIEHCMFHEKRNEGEHVELTAGKTKYIISIEQVALEQTR